MAERTPRSYRIVLELSASHCRTNVERVIYENEHSCVRLSIWQTHFSMGIPLKQDHRIGQCSIASTSTHRKFLLFSWYLFWETMIVIISSKWKKGVAESSTHFSTTRRLCHCEICEPSSKSTLWWLAAATRECHTFTHATCTNARKTGVWCLVWPEMVMVPLATKIWKIDFLLRWFGCLWRLATVQAWILFFESISDFSMLTIGLLLLLLFCRQRQRTQLTTSPMKYNTIERDSSSFIFHFIYSFRWAFFLLLLLSSIPTHGPHLGRTHLKLREL